MHHIALLGYLSINDWKTSQYHLGTGCISENDWKASQDTSGTGCNSKSDWKASWWGFVYQRRNLLPGCLFKMTKAPFSYDERCWFANRRRRQRRPKQQRPRGPRRRFANWRCCRNRNPLKMHADDWCGFGHLGFNLKPKCLFKITEMNPDVVLAT